MKEVRRVRVYQQRESTVKWRHLILSPHDWVVTRRHLVLTLIRTWRATSSLNQATVLCRRRVTPKSQRSSSSNHDDQVSWSFLLLINIYFDFSLYLFQLSKLSNYSNLIILDYFMMVNKYTIINFSYFLNNIIILYDKMLYSLSLIFLDPIVVVDIA